MMRNRAGLMKGKNGKLFSNGEMVSCGAEPAKNKPQISQTNQEKRDEIRRYHMEQERIRKEQAEEEQRHIEQKRLEKEMQQAQQLEKKRKEMESMLLITPTDPQLISAGMKLTFRPTNEIKILPQKKHITYEEMLLFTAKSNNKSNVICGEFENFLVEPNAYISTMVPLLYMHLIAISLGNFAYCDFLSKPRYDCIGVYFARKFADKMVSAEAYKEIFPAILPYFRENCCVNPEFNATEYKNWLSRFTQDNDLFMEPFYQRTNNLQNSPNLQNPEMAVFKGATSAFFCKFPAINVLQKTPVLNFVFTNNSIVCLNKSQTSILKQKMQITKATIRECSGFLVKAMAREFSNDYCKCYIFSDESYDAKYLFILPHGGICIESIIRADRSIENAIKMAVEIMAAEQELNPHEFTFPHFSYKEIMDPTEYTVKWIAQMSEQFPEDAKKYCKEISGHINNTAASYVFLNFELSELFIGCNCEESNDELYKVENDKVENDKVENDKVENDKVENDKVEKNNEKNTKHVIFNQPFLLIQLAKNNQLVSIMKIGEVKEIEKLDDIDELTKDPEIESFIEPKPEAKINSNYIVDDL